jgi:hypothetical protein
MKKSSAGLLVGLDGKLARVSKHWLAVDQVLPPDFPLLLLLGVGRAGLDELAERLPGLRRAVRDAELGEKLVWADYERWKRELHQWLLWINAWMRADYRGTNWFWLVQRVPGRGQSYEHWWDAAQGALSMWKMIVEDPPKPFPCGSERSLTMGGGETVEQFEQVVKAFKAAWAAIRPVAGKVKLARGALEMAQNEAASLLMAYGHGVQARLGQEGELVRSIPQLWPKHSTKPREERAAAAQRVVVRRRKAR